MNLQRVFTHLYRSFVSSSLTLSRYIGFTKGLQITLENTITLGETTTISYVTGSSDPSEWLLRNVYANGTTQIGGVLSGTGSVSFSFQLAGFVFQFLESELKTFILYPICTTFQTALPSSSSVVRRVPLSIHLRN